ncbi:hypothetical protein WA158_002484 [Blastocystis sp. Blastoise]
MDTYRNFLAPTTVGYLNISNDSSEFDIQKFNEIGIQYFHYDIQKDQISNQISMMIHDIIHEDYFDENLYIIIQTDLDEEILSKLISSLVTAGTLPIVLSKKTFFNYNSYTNLTISHEDFDTLLNCWSHFPQWKKPEPIAIPICCGDEVGNFPWITIKERIPDILEETIAVNKEWPHSYIQSVLSIKKMMLNSQLIENIPWKQHYPYLIVYLFTICVNRELYRKRNVMNTSWWFLEHYYFRYLLCVTDYYDRNIDIYHDPFLHMKENALKKIEPLMGDIFKDLIEEAKQYTHELPYSYFHLLILRSLWGNKADLSMSCGKLEGDVFKDKSSLSNPHIIIFSDNTGLELLSDFIFIAIYLLLTPTGSVTYFIKENPVFVSDITIHDVLYSIEWMKKHNCIQISYIGTLIEQYYKEKRIIFKSEYQLNSCLDMWSISTNLYEYMNNCTLIISKGDANYRRFVGDRHWNYDIPVNKVLSYVPKPLLLLRTLKSNCLIGIDENQQKEAKQFTEEWDVNGKIGIIQYYQPSF